MYDRILFDFDGTLADSSACSVIATRSAFAAAGLTPPTAEAITDQMGIPIEQSFREMGARDFSDAQFAALLAGFRQAYRDAGDSQITAFPGAVALLETLKAAGKSIAIITSKKTDVAQANAAALGLMTCIDLIVGSDRVSQYKPHPEGIFAAMTHWQADSDAAGRFIMVGDAVTDIIMGKGAGVATCAVTWGAHDREKLADSRPDYLVDDFPALLAVLMTA